MDRVPTKARALINRMGEIALWSVPTAILVFAGCFALAWASLGTDRTALIDQVREAYATGDLRPDGGALFGNVNIGEHQYNDCLILFQAIDDRASRLERAISPLRPAPDKQGICAGLKQLVTTGPAQRPDFYHRYFHAHTTLARLLVPRLGVGGLRDLYKSMASLALVAGIGLAMLDLAQRRRGNRGIVRLIIFLAFSRFFGLETFGQSLGHAPADLLIIGYLLVLSRVSADRPISRRFALISSALFGALTIEFEFLTGGLPLGLAVVIGTLPLALTPDGNALKTTFDAVISFLSGVLVCIIARALLLLTMFGSAPLTGAGSQLLMRTGVDAATGHLTASGFGDFLVRVLAGLESLAAGMLWLVMALVGVAVTAGIWGYKILRRDPDPATRNCAVALAASNIVLLLWIVLFWQHTAEHAWFMDRIFVWTLASGGVLFSLALSAGGYQPGLPAAGKER